jgi:hypothetical protein
MGGYCGYLASMAGMEKPFYKRDTIFETGQYRVPSKSWI